ncbi:hypothetical protein EVG20_g2945 [Dentipellis fragilis]|uniref:F-box domain-containing protein n=1 Tax=Dentipellis fragilis TaxID=205917 RepID=A0A4Y9Z4Z7_9AGAM|nr:hypothetical protein EVG20_g2945 [Dentipellis fragilis]
MLVSASSSLSPKCDTPKLKPPPPPPSPISRLPPELLCQIFAFSTARDTSQHGLATRSPPKWIAITYVCGQWREIALNDRSLWQDVTIDLSLRWAGHFINRSDPMPVDVEYEIKPLRPGRYTDGVMTQEEAQKSFLDWLLGRMNRIRKLYLRGYVAPISRHFPKLLYTASADILEDLSVEVLESWYPLTINGHVALTLVVLRMDLIFLGRAPKLHTLRVAGAFTMQRQLPKLHELRHLTHVDAALTFMDFFLKALQSMPALETLDIQHLADTHRSEPPEYTADLPHLTSVRITSTHHLHICHLAHHLRIPATACVHVRFIPKTAPKPEHWTQLSEALLQFHPRLSRSKVSRVDIQTDQAKSHIACWCDPLPVPILEAPPHTAAHFSFQLDFSGRLFLPTPYFFTAGFCTMIKGLGPASTPSLFVSDRYPSPLWQLDWARVFRVMTGVQELRVSHCIHAPLNAASSSRAIPPPAQGRATTPPAGGQTAPPPADGQSTTPPPDAQSATPPPDAPSVDPPTDVTPPASGQKKTKKQKKPTLPLPNLKKLVIADAVLSEDIDGDFWPLEQYLKYRKGRGATLEELIVRDCAGNFNAGQLTSFTTECMQQIGRKSNVTC